MNEIISTEMQTPIEIALGIDENGMTTARKLYAFLELRPDNFSRWCKSNITENQFAKENTDYLRLVFCDETPTGGRIQREDYKLSAGFAKKLSMMSKSEKGEQARQYFVRVEDRMKELTLPLRDMSPELQAILMHDQKIQQVEQKVESVNQDLQDLKMDLPILGIEIERITAAAKKKGVTCLYGKESNAYKNKSLRGKVYHDIYRELKRQFRVNTYKAIKRNQCDMAVNVISRYELPYILAE